MSEELSVIEQDELQRLEAVIAKGLETFFGSRMRVIRYFARNDSTDRAIRPLQITVVDAGM